MTTYSTSSFFTACPRDDDKKTAAVPQEVESPVKPRQKRKLTIRGWGSAIVTPGWEGPIMSEGMPEMEALLESWGIRKIERYSSTETVNTIQGDAGTKRAFIEPPEDVDGELIPGPLPELNEPASF